jgi:hypothetical protein
LPRRPRNRHNLHPTHYEDLEATWSTDTPLARRFLLGERVEFAIANPFAGSWITYWGAEGQPALPDPLIVEAGFDPAISNSDGAAKSALGAESSCALENTCSFSLIKKRTDNAEHSAKVESGIPFRVHFVVGARGNLLCTWSKQPHRVKLRDEILD